MRRVWLLLAALVAATGLALGAAVWFGVPLDGGPLRQIPLGQPVTVTLPERGAMLWVTTEGGRVSCEIVGVQPERGLSSLMLPDQSLTARTDGQTWHPAMLLTAYPPGEYTLTCTSSETSLATAEAPLIRDFRTRAVALLAAAMLTVAGLGTAAIVALRSGASGRRAGGPGWS
ncbi:hypothetical protein FHR83_006353 [Actinoplanes campanulatus]|uniref:Uncharacterized protein n=1 Tax=Actinoplanes campanulatus TaxID=113559 RepID=A0A7W5AMU9_9ACTN|nr:hypothetical protein [Actinoplanes campanulatus]MBB3098654.1 hypothetical protein [Actinoplanes campanulatus]GGN36343.1 hypothetical protein GCM10010109_61210 [Actinoplanes campanulatus]GID39344.1 hypothetical protein Aca09nite_58500 [Actinoplanes campanulatus]